ncbi:MAG: methylenetetrahydrofolate reductase, partial [Proteobacteria bacterium]|nr:methylenetetrahydrofolate reductase [Pseudomonadota bacterium]
MEKTDTTSDHERTDPLTIALQGLSLEIGVHDLEALDRNRRLLPTGGRIYVNAVAGENPEARITTAAQLTAYGYQPVPHIAARRMRTVEELDDYLAGFVQRAGVSEILVIGGDVTEPLGPYGDALDVIASGLPAKHGIRRIGIAGYPDGHPDIETTALNRALETKLAACRKTATDPYIVTQFSFQARSIIDWCRATHDKHPDLRIHAGIPGPAKLRTLMRFARICGVQSSMKKLLANKKTGLDLLRGAAPWEQLEAIGQYRLETGRPLSAHLFTFGGLTETVSWLQQVR